jgi:hypothetical protein
MRPCGPPPPPAVYATLDELSAAKLGLRRIEQHGEDTYKPGTAAPQAYQRVIAGLEYVDPEVEDLHDAILADADTAKAADAEDDGVFQGNGTM